MTKKPDCTSAMKKLITEVRGDFPFNVPEANICGISCIGCPKKLLEIVDTELCDWESKLDNHVVPKFGEISQLGKLCKNVRRGLKRNGLVE
ncbi:hypothetical protein [Colwellia psychrerythraea]|jgi:hypothetical protein|uniref:Uncharacterized protein n=1 Tax=Colwellia psychrerythraea (strain 34H / ATCC BAA-681) TaxID=167879 RepID=Q485R7_COLP3|nr:hypothetical protein [Colwellia psychrerythraea]AAZ27392.1 hypothetical protein CPS_1456 [Colwellia psychrerythraea 34H]